MSPLDLVHLATTLAMTGIIWSVQCVQYPLFAHVGDANFSEYHEAHVERMGYVVGPLMLVEVATAVALAAQGRSGPFVLSLCLLAVAWGSTFAIQVPLHRKLGVQRSADLIQRLIRSNWIRTFAWTARASLLCSILMPGA